MRPYTGWGTIWETPPRDLAPGTGAGGLTRGACEVEDERKASVASDNSWSQTEIGCGMRAHATHDHTRRMSAEGRRHEHAMDANVAAPPRMSTTGCGRSLAAESLLKPRCPSHRGRNVIAQTWPRQLGQPTTQATSAPPTLEIRSQRSWGAFATSLSRVGRRRAYSMGKLRHAPRSTPHGHKRSMTMGMPTLRCELHAPQHEDSDTNGP